MFGIKNARRSAGQDELLFGGCVDQLLTFGASVGFGDDDVVLGHEMVELSGSRYGLVRGRLVARRGREIQPGG